MEHADIKKDPCFRLLNAKDPAKVGILPPDEVYVPSPPHQMRGRDLLSVIDGKEEDSFVDPTEGIEVPSIEQLKEEGFPLDTLKPCAYRTWLLWNEEGKKVFAKKYANKKFSGKKRPRKEESVSSASY